MNTQSWKSLAALNKSVWYRLLKVGWIASTAYVWILTLDSALVSYQSALWFDSEGPDIFHYLILILAFIGVPLLSWLLMGVVHYIILGVYVLPFFPKMPKNPTTTKTIKIRERRGSWPISSLRAQEILTEPEKRFIKAPTISVFAPFYAIARKLWLIVVLSFLAPFFYGVAIAMFQTSPDVLQPILYLLSLFHILILISLVLNARRWSWNVNRFRDFETFQKSEENWGPWGFLGLAFIIVRFIAEFIF